MKKRKKRVSDPGLINGGLNFLSDKILTLLKTGFLGKLFSSSDSLDSKAARGIIVGSIDYAVSGEVSSYKRKNMRTADESSFVSFGRHVGKYLESRSLGWYGLYFFIFAFYTLLIHCVKNFFIGNGSLAWDLLSSEYVVVSAFVILASVILMRSDKSLRYMVSNSRLLRPLFEDFAGVSENSFEDVPSETGLNSYFFAITLGILTGAITYFTSPLNVIFILAMMCVVGVVVRLPELGVLLTIFIAPFLELFRHPTIILLAIILVDLVAYISKVLVGKRTFRFRLTDAMVCLLATLFAFGGIVTSGGTESLKSALTYFALMFIYVLVVNLFDSREWLARCVIAIAAPSVLVSLYGVLGYALTKMPSKWMDMSMFSDITNRAISLFDNPNTLATYLILTAPFVWICALYGKISAKLRFCAVVGSIASTICTVLTWSRGAWMGIIAAIIVFLLINSRYSLKYMLAVGLSLPIWSRLLPQNVTNRFLSIGNLADSSTYYRLYTWKGSIKLLSDYWLTGIGVGEAAFTQIYPLYSFAGNETTVHSHNVFLQIAIELGVVALIIFVFTMFLLVQKGFCCLKTSSDRWIKLFTSAAMSGLIAALVHGMVDYIWYNYRVFFMFWVVAALVCVSMDVCQKEKLKNGSQIFTMRDRSVSLDIIF